MQQGFHFQDTTLISYKMGILIMNRVEGMMLTSFYFFSNFGHLIYREI
jgi:hypothetical protein